MNDAPRDPLGCAVPATHQLGIGAFVGVPLVLGDGTVYGTLCALDRGASALAGEEVAVLQVLARLVAHEVERGRLLAAVRERGSAGFGRWSTRPPTPSSRSTATA